MSAGAPDSQARVGFCAIVGLPNVGKSTLLNCVLDKRLVAVSNKPQTTRNRIRGVHNVDTADGRAAQIIFVDTPGVQKGTGALRDYMRDEALAAAGDCDVAVLMLDVSEAGQRSLESVRGSEVRTLLQSLESSKVPVVLALNKVDRVPDKELLLPMLSSFAEGDFAAVVPLSAQKGKGVEALVEEVAKRLPEGPKLFPEEMYTDRAERFLAAELIREQLFRQLGDELPYATACVVERWDERTDQGDLVIDAVIFVERASQKAIVIGKGGARIKTVGERARRAISELLGCPVHVKLFVKVSTNWSRDARGIRSMGYEK